MPETNIPILREPININQGGAVSSVNGQTGDVILTAEDVGAATAADVAEAVGIETTAREGADNNLQGQIDALSAASDVTDVVGTYADLQAYDTSTLSNNDIIKVLQDEEHNDETTYYRWSTSTETFTLIGEEGPYYTKAAADEKFQNKLVAGDNITIGPDNTISASGDNAIKKLVLDESNTILSGNIRYYNKPFELETGLYKIVYNFSEAESIGKQVAIAPQSYNNVGSVNTTYALYFGASHPINAENAQEMLVWVQHYGGPTSTGATVYLVWLGDTNGAYTSMGSAVVMFNSGYYQTQPNYATGGENFGKILIEKSIGTQWSATTRKVCDFGIARKFRLGYLGHQEGASVSGNPSVLGWTAIGNGSKYTKRALQVTLNIAEDNLTIAANTWTSVGLTMPTNFRPSEVIYGSVAASDGTTMETGLVRVNTDGTVEVKTTNATTDIYGSIVFPVNTL